MKSAQIYKWVTHKCSRRNSLSRKQRCERWRVKNNERININKAISTLSLTRQTTMKHPSQRFVVWFQQLRIRINKWLLTAAKYGARRPRQRQMCFISCDWIYYSIMPHTLCSLAPYKYTISNLRVGFIYPAFNSTLCAKWFQMGQTPHNPIASRRARKRKSITFVLSARMLFNWVQILRSRTVIWERTNALLFWLI